MNNSHGFVRVGILVGLFVLMLWPSTIQAAEMQDTLNAIIKRGEIQVGSFDIFPRGDSWMPRTIMWAWTWMSPKNWPTYSR